MYLCQITMKGNIMKIVRKIAFLLYTAAFFVFVYYAFFATSQPGWYPYFRVVMFGCVATHSWIRVFRTKEGRIGNILVAIILSFIFIDELTTFSTS